MEFGRLPSVDGIDFTLPPDPAENAAVLARAGEAGAVDLRIGMASWSDPGLAARLGGGDALGVLRAHASAVPAHELNSSFYGYTRERFARWAGAAPPGFLFCPKLPSSITHERVLEGADDEMEAFVRATEALGDRRGLTWFALPPFVAPDHYDRLLAFLERWAPEVPLAVEMREERWFRSRAGFADLCGALEELGVTLILTDTAGRRDCAHVRLTTRTAFVRFVANALHPSDFTRLDEWADRLARWADGGLERAYVFLHQRDEAETVDLADHLERRLAERGLPVLAPWRARTRYEPPGRQLGLF
ncbi:MAG: DUF72 domain-containing protein [Planctomycetota bacterium]